MGLFLRTLFYGAILLNIAISLLSISFVAGKKPPRDSERSGDFAGRAKREVVEGDSAVTAFGRLLRK